jgi:glycosyltransferase involved in cell wall biosynthesis
MQTVAVMCFSSGTGGMERSAVRLARFLSSIMTVVLVCKKGSFVERLYHEEQADYACEPIPFLSRTFSPTMLFGARSVITKYDVKNVIFFGASELKTLHFSFIGKKLNLVVWHGTTKSRPKRDFIHKLIYSDVNFHVALSEHLIRNVKTIVPETQAVRYRVIRPSFDFAVNIRDERKDDDMLSIVHVGRVAYGKGQADAVTACRALKDRGTDFNLKLVGSADESNYIDEVKDAIVKYDLGDSVTLEGYVESVNAYLEHADILLFPSSGEGMPNAFIEALHYDIVCIAYDNTVFPEFLEMGFYIHLVEDSDVEKLSARLVQVVSNIDEEKLKAKNNMSLAKSYFSVDRELAEWKEVLI